MMQAPLDHQLWASLIPLVGRRAELEDLASAVRARRSRLVTGPGGIGKTRLIHHSLTAAGLPSVWLRAPRALQQLLVDLAHHLNAPPERFGDLQRASSASLRRIVQDTLRENPQRLVLDDLMETDPRMYRFLQQVYYVPGVSLVVGTRSRASLGFLRKLRWDPREEISLKPLRRVEAGGLFILACSAFGLDCLNLDDFKRKVLAAAQGNPGQILAMCRLACRPQYRVGRHVEFLPLRIDSLTESL